MAKFLLALTCIFSFSALAQDADPVIQRYGIVGTDSAGKRLAVMLTHFGPSSGAPFANLLVLEAGKADPLLKDGLFMMQGGEAELAQMASALLETNKLSLDRLGINMTSPIYGDANYILGSTSPSITGTLDIENLGFFNFQIDNEKSEQCKEAFTQITVKMGNNTITRAPASPNECLPGPLQLRNIMRTKAAAWFFLLKRVDSFGIPFFSVNVLGLGW